MSSPAWFEADSLDLDAKYGSTTLSNTEVFMLGEALLVWLGTCIRLGHASPGSTLDYTTSPEHLSLGGLIVRDVIAWTSGRVELAPGCEQRVRDLMEAADIEQHFADQVGQILGGAA
jgi:hypothetical protein